MLKTKTWGSAPAALVLLALGVHPTNVSAALPTACPTQPTSSAELISLRQQLVTQEESTPSDIQDFLGRCYGGAKVPACLAPVQDFANQALAANAGSNDVAIELEPRKQPPRELLTNLDESTWTFEFRPDVEKIATSLGWPNVRYKSRHAGGFDRETPSLLMILVPGASLTPPVNYDRYLNIALPADTGAETLNPTPQAPFPLAPEYAAEVTNGTTMPRTFTIVSMEKPTATDRAKVYFQMFERGGFGNGKFTASPNININGCLSCHPNGLRAISPLGFHVRKDEAQMDPVNWEKVATINDAMETSGGFAAPDWRAATDTSGKAQKYYVPAGVGPIIGPFEPLSVQNTTGANGQIMSIHPTRTQNFLVGTDGKSGCAYSVSTRPVRDIFSRPPGVNNVYQMDPAQPPVRWQKIRDAMKCSECHDNQARGAFNSLTDFTQIEFKVLVDQSMPLNLHKDPMQQGSPTKPVVDLLTGNERIALVNCLQAEFTQQESQQLDAWLKRVSCSQ